MGTTHHPTGSPEPHLGTRPRQGEAFMKDRNLRFYAIAALWLALFALLYLSNRRIDLNVGINKSTGVSVSIEDVVSLSPPEVTAKA